MIMTEMYAWVHVCLWVQKGKKKVVSIGEFIFHFEKYMRSKNDCIFYCINLVLLKHPWFTWGPYNARDLFLTQQQDVFEFIEKKRF